MIFISHTSADKSVVEPIAIRLSEIFGQDKIFYDSWSIQPGDGIIDKMDQGLAECKFFFFFVSSNSLQSKMVNLEWQNALFTATMGECKVIPIRLDSCDLPLVMRQNLYIDLYTNGIEAALTQIVNVIQGNNTFTPKHGGFSNLTFSLSGDERKLLITIAASHYLEPIPNFLILVENEKAEVKFKLPRDGPHREGFNPDIQLNDGQKFNGQFIAPFRGITPEMPLIVEALATSDKPIKFGGVMHQKGHNKFQKIPEKLA